MSMVLLFAVMASGLDRLYVLAALLFVGYGFVGLVMIVQPVDHVLIGYPDAAVIPKACRDLSDSLRPL